MKWINYSNYTGEDFGIDAEDLLKALSDFLLQSGFNNPYMPVQRVEPAHAGRSEAGHPAGARAGRAVRRRAACSEMMEQPAEHVARADGPAARQPGAEAGRRRPDHASRSPRTQPAGRRGRRARTRKVKFEVTDKSLDFLGFKTLKDLLGSLGKSSFGRHDTRDLATGIEATGSSKQYEFGDTLNLDISETLFSAIRREGAQGAAQSGILRPARAPVRIPEFLRHGADARLQPQHDPLWRGPLHAGQESGAGAGASDPHAISRRQPALRAVPRFAPKNCAISQLARVQVGPYYTNTRDGLILAQRLLQQEKQGHEQIVMITDGKPSAA